MNQQIDAVLRSLRVLLRFYLTDPLLYVQLLLFAALVAGTALLARRLQRTQWRLPGGRWQSSLNLLYFPIFGLIGGRLISAILQTQALTVPVFNRLYALFWILLLYRVALLAGKALIPRNVEILRKRVLLPLAILMVVLRLLGQLGLFVSVLNAPFIYFGQIEISLSLLLLAPFALIVVFLLAQGLRTLLIEDLLPQAGLPTSRSYAIGTLAGYIVVIGGALLTLRAFGIPLSTLAFLSGALAVGVGLGLQNTINQFVSGFLIMFDPNISVGDLVEVSGERGVVQQIGIRNTVIATSDGTQMVMPNATLSSSPVLNLTASSRVSRVALNVTAPNADPRQLQEVISSILQAQPQITATPPPTVVLRSFAPGTTTFEVIFWVADATQKDLVTHEVNVSIWERLHDLGYDTATVTPPA